MFELVCGFRVGLGLVLGWFRVDVELVQRGLQVGLGWFRLG